jgi:hypothetical protein
MRARLITAFAAVYLVWGSTYLAIRFAVETLPPLLMAGSRFVIAGLIVLLWARWREGAKPPTRTEWRVGVISGVLLLLGGNRTALDGAAGLAEAWRTKTSDGGIRRSRPWLGRPAPARGA